MPRAPPCMGYRVEIRDKAAWKNKPTMYKAQKGRAEDPRSVYGGIKSSQLLYSSNFSRPPREKQRSKSRKNKLPDGRRQSDEGA